MKRLFILLIFVSFIISNCSNIRPEGGSSFVSVTVGSDAKTAKIKIEKATIFARIKMFLKGIMPDTAIAAIPSTVNKITITIEGADMETIRRNVNVSGQSEITEDFTVSNGDNRRFVVDAESSSGAVIYSGSATANLTGEPVNLTIDMALRPWARTYGGGGGYQTIQQTSDGGYIVAGYTSSFGAGGADFWVLKLNAEGTVAWERAYGGTADDYDAFSIPQTSDGGYIVTGYTYSFGAGSADGWILKLNADSAVAWERTYGGTGGDWTLSIQQTSDGGYIVAGYTTSFGAGGYDLWVLKLNADGTVAWENAYGGTGNDFAYSIQQTSDGGYIVAGGTVSFGAGNYDAWVLKFNSDGSVAWQKTYGGTGNDYIYSIQQTTDGGYIAGVQTDSFGAGGWDAWVLKLDGSGNVQWQKTYGGAGSDVVNSIQQTTDGGYIMACETASFGGYDSWILKLNADGTVGWQKTYGGAGSDSAFSIQQTTDGGYIVAGGSDSFGASAFWILKLSSDGTISFNASSGASTTDTNVAGVDPGVTPAITTATITTTSAVVGSAGTAITITDTNTATQQQAP